MIIDDLDNRLNLTLEMMNKNEKVGEFKNENEKLLRQKIKSLKILLNPYKKR
jgi:hypothetical protein